jgi:hypothetical protein
MAEHIPSFDDFFKKRLGEHASPVPEDMFDRMMKHRAEKQWDSIALPSLADRLNNYDAPVPEDMFERMMRERAGKQLDNITPPSLTDRLNNYDAPVPTDMFDRIMDERERRRPAIAWWQTPRIKWAVAASLLVLVMVIMGKSYLCAPSSHTEIATTDNQKKETAVDYPSQTTQQNPIAGTIQGNQVSNHELTTIVTNANNYNKNITKPELQSKKPENSIKAVSNSTTITSNHERLNNNNLIQNTIPNTSLNTPHQFYNPTISTPESQKIASAVLDPLSVKNTEGVSISDVSLDKLLKAQPCLMPGTDACPTFTIRKSSRLRYYVDAFGAPEYAFRSLKASTDEYLNYRNTRDTVERTNFGYSAGTRASAVLRNGIVLRGGIVYARNNEVLRKDSSTIRLMSVTISQITGDTIGWNYEGGIIRKTRQNNVQTLDFTAQVGYELPIGEKLSIGINAGANINVLTQIKATILDKDLQLLTLNESNTIYNKSVGTSLVGSVAAYYHLTDRLDLMVEPYVKHYLKPLSKNPDYQLRQSYTNTGLIIGVRFRL